MNRSQPWIHSWYVDSLCFFLIPLTFLFLAFFKLPPFNMIVPGQFSYAILVVLFIDWGHIFAQYHRIYSNPLEEKRLKIIYPLSYLLMIPLVAVVVHMTDSILIDTLLVYFVIFHFIKQHFGFMKVYSKTDGQKSRRESLTETILFYSSMAAPVLLWHVKGIGYDFKWTMRFWKPAFLEFLIWPVFALYAVSFVLYVIDEYKRTKRNELFNIPKNLSLATAMLGWGGVSLLTDAPMLIMFSVVLTHDMSYFFYVWIIGRRDHHTIKKKVHWFSWWSVPGFLVYFIALIALGDIIMTVHLESTQDPNWDYFFWGKTLNGIGLQQGWMLSFGYAIFFATQAHHYYIDRYLWKKEKDLSYMVKTGRIQLSDLS